MQTDRKENADDEKRRNVLGEIESTKGLEEITKDFFGADVNDKKRIDPEFKKFGINDATDKIAKHADKIVEKMWDREKSGKPMSDEEIAKLGEDAVAEIAKDAKDKLDKYIDSKLKSGELPPDDERKQSIENKKTWVNFQVSKSIKHFLKKRLDEAPEKIIKRARAEVREKIKNDPNANKKPLNEDAVNDAFSKIGNIRQRLMRGEYIHMKQNNVDDFNDMFLPFGVADVGDRLKKSAKDIVKQYKEMEKQGASEEERMKKIDEMGRKAKKDIHDSLNQDRLKDLGVSDDRTEQLKSFTADAISYLLNNAVVREQNESSEVNSSYKRGLTKGIKVFINKNGLMHLSRIDHVSKEKIYATLKNGEKVKFSKSSDRILPITSKNIRAAKIISVLST